MNGDPLHLRATPDRIRTACRGAGLSDGATERALDITLRTPPLAEWRRFLSTALALLGAGLLLAGAVCFVAYNWDRIGRFGKFALVGGAIVAATLTAWRKLPRLSGQVAVFCAAVLVGPLLALYGQTYQTGADPYGLFLTWSALIVPWVVIARFSPLWVLALIVLDVGLLLYAAQILESAEAALYFPVIIAALHAVAMVAWEWQARREQPWLVDRWAVRLVAVIGFVAISFPAVALVLPHSEAGIAGFIGLAGLVAAIIATLGYYRRSRPDHFMITIAVVTGMAWVTWLVGRLVLDVADLDEFGFFVMAIFIVWEIAMGVRWYRRAT